MCMPPSSKTGRARVGQSTKDTEYFSAVRKEHLLHKTRATFMLKNEGKKVSWKIYKYFLSLRKQAQCFSQGQKINTNLNVNPKHIMKSDFTVYKLLLIQ